MGRGIDSCRFSLTDEAPFYVVALQGIAKLFVSEWAFPARGWKGRMSAGQFVFAWCMIFFACNTAINDAVTGVDYLKVAWLFIIIAWPAFLCGMLFLFFAVLCKAYDEGCKRFMFKGFTFCMIILFLSTFYMNFRIRQWARIDPKFFVDLNCSSLEWSGSSQIVSVIQSCAVVYQSFKEREAPHWTRHVTLLPWVLLNIILYFPVLSLLFATHIIPGALEFFPFTIAIVALLVCYIMVTTIVHNKVKKRAYQMQEQLLKEAAGRAAEQMETCSGFLSDWYNYITDSDYWEKEQEEEERVEQAKFDLEVSEINFRIKSAAVPFMLVVKFLGEVIVRYRLGDPWWGSVWKTWSERTLIRYTEHVYRSMNAKFSLVQAIV